MNIFCIIPARGGSKGIPGKNIISFQGKPLLVHSIDYALGANSDIQVFVSTDDEGIAQVSRNAGARVIPRPTEISGDEATTESAIEHALGYWQDQGLIPDIIILLQATSPLRPAGSLDEALEHFHQGGFDSLLSLSPTHRFFWSLKGDEAQAEYDYQHRPRRQDLKADDIRYIENGSLYIFTRGLFERVKNRLGGKIGYVIFPESYAVELDSQADLLLLEKLAGDLRNT